MTRNTLDETDIEKKRGSELDTKDFKGANILLVEDNIVNQKVAVCMLEKLNCIVSVAENGKDAISMFEKTSYDLIFMDCQMPEMDGYEATAEIRRREGGARHVPIIAMTAHVMGGARERCLEAGMDDYISKPIQDYVLREILHKYLVKDISSPSGSKTAMDYEEEEAPVDFQYIKDIFGEDFEAINELINIYIQDVAKIMAALKSAINEKNAEMIKYKAHSLKGASANIGASKLKSLCADLEKIGISGNIDGALDLYVKIKAELERVKEFLMSKLS